MCSSLNTDFYSLKVIFLTGCCNFFFFFLFKVSLTADYWGRVHMLPSMRQHITKAGRKTPDISIDFSFLHFFKKNKKNLLFFFFPPSHTSLKAESLTEDEMARFEVCFPAALPPRCLAVIVGALQRRRWGNGIRCGECFKCLLCGGLKKRR